MELSDYGRIIKRWFPLIAAGTLLALALGLAIEYKSRAAASSTTYQSSARVQINYTSLSYIGGMSFSQQESALAARIHDPGVLVLNPRVGPPPGVKSLTAFVQTNGNVVVQAAATTGSVARLAANRGAQYLVRAYDNKVRNGAKITVRQLRQQVNRDRAKWLRFATRLAYLTGPPALASRSTLARLSALASYWQDQYNNDRGNLVSNQIAGEPPAQMIGAYPATPVKSKPLSPFKSVLPAGIIGLALSFLLAAFLESRRSRTADSEALAALPPTPETHVRLPSAVSLPQANPQLATEAAGVVEYQPDERSTVLVSLAEPMTQTADLVSGLVISSSPSLFITSPTKAEPKAETSVGLASSLALRGRKVVLVDADPAGALSHFFGLSGRPGLTDYLGYPNGSLTQLVYSTTSRPNPEASPSFPTASAVRARSPTSAPPPPMAT